MRWFFFNWQLCSIDKVTQFGAYATIKVHPLLKKSPVHVNTIADTAHMWQEQFVLYVHIL